MLSTLIGDFLSRFAMIVPIDSRMQQLYDRIFDPPVYVTRARSLCFPSCIKAEACCFPQP